MLYDPMAHFALHKHLEPQHRNSTGAYPGPTVHELALWGNAQPFAATIALDELSRLLPKGGLRQFFRNLFLSDPDPIEVRSHYEDRLGFRLPVADEAFAQMMDEVRRFQWLEAEKAGKDIWRQRYPEDPEGGALREWFARHFGAWYLTHERKKITL
jgi:hypothetical protein